MDNKDIVIVGYGGHAKSIADAIESTKQYRIVGYTDFEDFQDSNYKYLGTDDVLTDLFKKDVRYAIIGLGNMGNSSVRNKIYHMLRDIGYQLPVIIDQSAVVSSKATIEPGTFVGKNAIINAYAHVGKNCIINTGAIIEHECEIGDGTHIAVGTVLCGQCVVGEDSLIGANSTVIQCKSVGKNTIIGAGSVVTTDIAANVIAVGTPAKVIKENG